jgi:acetylornithine deacetylase/succinyl-diaminopimelate desuccinylase-like protein
MLHVALIAQRPHPMGSVDHDRVRDYILFQLSQLGLAPQVQHTTAIGTRYREAGRVQNILARLTGTQRNGKAVLIMAHYDGVEAGPAASDDGAGSAALLETLRALRARKKPLTHDVIALFTDGEEAGLLGAAAFVREHPWAKDVGVALNFEARARGISMSLAHCATMITPRLGRFTQPSTARCPTTPISPSSRCSASPPSISHSRMASSATTQVMTTCHT